MRSGAALNLEEVTVVSAEVVRFPPSCEPSPECLHDCGGIVGSGAEPRRSHPGPNLPPFERIDELACVVALLARSPLENSSPVHPAI